MARLRKFYAVVTSNDGKGRKTGNVCGIYEAFSAPHNRSYEGGGKRINIIYYESEDEAYRAARIAMSA